MHSPLPPPFDILIIEDDYAIRESLSLVLSEDGYAVHAVMHGQDALSYLAIVPVLPRLILLDLMMPIMAGFEFRHLQRQDQRLRNIPVAVLSAISHRLDPMQIMQLDAVAYIGKPIDWSRLRAVIHTHCPPNNA
jgi:CheY-like chemotaxis protein